MRILPTRHCHGAHSTKKGRATSPTPFAHENRSTVSASKESYGVITVEPVALPPFEVVTVTVTVIGPLPATYDRVC